MNVGFRKTILEIKIYVLLQENLEPFIKEFLEPFSWGQSG